MTKEIEKAQKRFEEFVTTTCSYNVLTINAIVAEIGHALSKVGKDLSALDPESNSSADEMKERLKKARERAHIVSAQKQFEQLETTTNSWDEDYIDKTAAEIKEHVKRAGKDLSALDAEGNSSVLEMEERLIEATKRAHVVSAQKRFTDFETPTVNYGAGSIDHIASTIKDHIARSGFDLAALDKSGQANTSEMESRLSAAQSRLYRRLAW